MDEKGGHQDDANATQTKVSGTPAQPSPEARMPTIGKWILFVVLLVIGWLPIVVWPFVSGLAFPHSASVSYVLSYVLPFVALMLVSGAASVFYWRTDTAMETVTQAFVLLITIASFYAFGWPKEIESHHQMREAFGELAVILVLFLLAELAAHLTTEARGIGQKIEIASGGTVKSISDATTAAVAEIRTALGQNSQVLASVEPIVDPSERQRVLHTISEYTRAWSGVLQRLADRDPLSEAKRSCILSFFNTYLDEEIGDLGWDKGTGTLKKMHIAMATNDGLYLKILNGVLESMERHSSDRCFAWAITNVRPEDFYHWGEAYGHLGAHPVMEEFRATVRKIVADDRWEYQRLFLIANAEQESLEERRSILLKTADQFVNQKKRVLLLSATSAGQMTPSDVARPIEVWRQLIHTNYIEGLHPGARAYGIVDLSEAMEKKWRIDEPFPFTYTESFRRIEFTFVPKLLLEYFEQTYHTKGGMFGLLVSEDFEMPEGNLDWLIVGTRKSDDNYSPVVAISANLSPTFNTMLMGIYTDDNELARIRELWEGLNGSKLEFVEAINQIEDILLEPLKSREA